MKFVRRKTPTDYTETKSVTIFLGSVPGSDTENIPNVPKAPDTAIEVELDDGTIVVLLGYVRR